MRRSEPRLSLCVFLGLFCLFCFAFSRFCIFSPLFSTSLLCTVGYLRCVLPHRCV
jgi:hypothetical protein